MYACTHANPVKIYLHRQKATFWKGLHFNGNRNGAINVQSCFPMQNQQRNSEASCQMHSIWANVSMCENMVKANAEIYTSFTSSTSTANWKCSSFCAARPLAIMLAFYACVNPLIIQTKGTMSSQITFKFRIVIDCLENNSSSIFNEADAVLGVGCIQMQQ